MKIFYSEIFKNFRFSLFFIKNNFDQLKFKRLISIKISHIINQMIVWWMNIWSSLIIIDVPLCNHSLHFATRFCDIFVWSFVSKTYLWISTMLHPYLFYFIFKHNYSINLFMYTFRLFTDIVRNSVPKYGAILRLKK